MDFARFLRGRVMAAGIGVCAALAAVEAAAIEVTVDPGMAGSTIAPDTVFNVSGLPVPVANRVMAVDIMWGDGKYLDFSSIDDANIFLDLDFSNASGTFGSGGFGIGGLLDADGHLMRSIGVGGAVSPDERRITLYVGPFRRKAFGMRYYFELLGADAGTTLTAATLQFHEGGIQVGLMSEAVIPTVQGPVPEPATPTLMAIGLLLLIAARGAKRSTGRFRPTVEASR
jgi:hypothetical protein